MLSSRTKEVSCLAVRESEAFECRKRRGEGSVTQKQNCCREDLDNVVARFLLAGLGLSLDLRLGLDELLLSLVTSALLVVVRNLGGLGGGLLAGSRLGLSCDLLPLGGRAVVLVVILRVVGGGSLRRGSLLALGAGGLGGSRGNGSIPGHCEVQGQLPVI